MRLSLPAWIGCAFLACGPAYTDGVTITLTTTLCAKSSVAASRTPA
jgi:hypothetical protein